MVSISISSFFELLAIGLLLWGYYNKEKVIAWEQKQSKKFKNFYRALRKRGNK